MEIDSGVMAALGGSTTWGEGRHSLCHHHFRLQYVVMYVSEGQQNS